MMEASFNTRRCGILLHPTSLPGTAAQGRLNDEALRFLDFLANCGASVWQMLPLGPTASDRSPYQSPSSFALNPELLDRDFAEPLELSMPPPHFRDFLQHNAYWLDDYALYCALKQQHLQRSWVDWPEHLRDRNTAALLVFAEAHAQLLDEIKREQYLLHLSWQRIKAHAKRLEIKLFGDLPIFVAHDSADVWAHRDLFNLDQNGQPLTVAGVPPDYFSATGQRWGNPHYRWDRMAQDGFQWWLQRLTQQLERFDWVRIDHFRGLEAYWEIPASEHTAVNGHWQPGPGTALLNAFKARFDALPIVAEDLGIITPAVNALRKQFGLPGMKILQFAFDNDARNPYLPHRHSKNCVVYTGTHDNDTTLGWFNSLRPETQQHCLNYLNHPQEAMPWPLIQTALASVANTTILPMQDLLGLDSSCRMNTPGTTVNNWQWRFQWEQVDSGLAQKMKALNGLYGRGT